MNEIVKMTGSTVTMTSLELVDFINEFRKEQAAQEGQSFPSKGYAELSHANFLKKVPDVLGGGVVKFSETYTHPQNRQEYPMYRFPKREACLMAMSYSYELQARVFDRMTELEGLTGRPKELTTLEILQIALESEQKRIVAEQERDHAIATKAQIGSKREATAMAAASVASRENAKLRRELGWSTRQATVLAVEKMMGTPEGTYSWRPLKMWCEENGVTPQAVPDRHFGAVKAWPAGAWLAAHGVDLSSLFSKTTQEAA